MPPLLKTTVLSLVTALAACEPTPPAAPTVAYYRAHTIERRHMVRACANDPAKARGRADCTNALEADAIESLGSLRELPPMKLPLPDSLAPEASPRN